MKNIIKKNLALIEEFKTQEGRIKSITDSVSALHTINEDILAGDFFHNSDAASKYALNKTRIEIAPRAIENVEAIIEDLTSQIRSAFEKGYELLRASYAELDSILVPKAIETAIEVFGQSTSIRNADWEIKRRVISPLRIYNEEIAPHSRSRLSDLLYDRPRSGRPSALKCLNAEISRVSDLLNREKQGKANQSV